MLYLVTKPRAFYHDLCLLKIKVWVVKYKYYKTFIATQKRVLVINIKLSLISKVVVQLSIWLADKQ